MKPVLVISIAITFFITPFPALAGHLIVDYMDDFGLSDSLYSAKLTVADFDADGRDDIFVSDDYGSFHIFALHSGKFEELWISDPLNIEYGSIKWLGALEGSTRQSTAYALDASNILHKFSYKGYIFGETGSWEIPSGGFLINALIYSNAVTSATEFMKLAMLKGSKFEIETYILQGDTALTQPSIGIETPLTSIPAIAFDKTTLAPVLLIVKKFESGNQTWRNSLNVSTVDGDGLAEFPFKGYNPDAETLALVTLDAQGKILAMSFGPADDMTRVDARIWRQEGSNLIPGPIRKVIANRDIGAGDIDGDKSTEIIIVGIDGLIRILDEDPFTYKLDGAVIEPSTKAHVESGEVYQDKEFLKKLGITIVENQGSLVLKKGGTELTYQGGPDAWEPSSGNGNSINVKTDPYGIRKYPLSTICIALGFAFRYRVDVATVEVYS